MVGGRPGAVVREAGIRARASSKARIVKVGAHEAGIAWDGLGQVRQLQHGGQDIMLS